MEQNKEGEPKKPKKVKIADVVEEAKPEPQKEIPLKRKLELLRSRLLPLTCHFMYGPHLSLSDGELKKWLKVSENNVLLAETKIRRCIQLKRKFKVYTLLTDYKPPPVLEKFFPGGICGMDKQGSPVYYELLGRLEMKNILQAVGKRDLLIYKMYQLEKIVQLLKSGSINICSTEHFVNKETGEVVTSILMIVDMQGTTKDILWGPTIRTWAEVIEVMQELYPGLIKEIIVVNTHFLYHEFYLALRPYICRDTLRGLKVLGINQTKYLLERIEKHELPAYLGGYKCDVDNNPLCRNQIKWNCRVPQWQTFTDSRMAGHVMNKTILAGEKLVEEHHVSLPRSLMSWEFHKLSHPVVFSIHLNEFGDKNRIMPRKLLSIDSPDRVGFLTCHSAGRYLITIDNCKDYAHPAHVQYKIVVSPPDGLISSLGPKVPLGDSINFSAPIGERERNMRTSLTQTVSRWRGNDLESMI